MSPSQSQPCGAHMGAIETQSLLPCPFCGSEQVSLSYCTNVDSVVSGRFVECEDCAACGPVHPDNAYAAWAWNLGREAASPEGGPIQTLDDPIPPSTQPDGDDR